MIEPTVTYTFKSIDGCDLQANVYGEQAKAPRPVILYLHGGALMMGSRTGVPQPQLALRLAEGYAIVSIDYRLAPESPLPDILQDVQDAFHWVRTQGPALFQADPARIAVMGHSAGGYLALLAGHRVEPGPQAIISYYGYGDIMGPWYSRPDPFYCSQPAVSEEVARSAVGTLPVVDGSGHELRWQYYLYCRQQGTWPQAVLGIDPAVEPEAFFPFCPERNVTPDYPPTLLVHGDQDTDVPYALSVSMAAALAQAGVPHEFITITGSGHSFDWVSTDPQVAAAQEAVGTFLHRYLR